MSDDTFGTWPNAKRPGVPLHPDQNGFHWMECQDNNHLMTDQWSADLHMWVVCYLDCFTKPSDMAHLDYLGPIAEPLHRDGQIRKHQYRSAAAAAYYGQWPEATREDSDG